MEAFSLVVGILSSRKTAHRAEAVRRTWLAPPLPPSVEAYFLVGSPGRPPEIDGDVLFLDCGDAYEDLVHKVRAFLLWVSEYRRDATVFKCDDDTYVDLPNLLRVAARLEGGYHGHVLHLESAAMEARARSWHRDKVSDPSFGHSYEGRLGSWCDGGVGYFLAPDARRALLEVEPWRPDGYVGEDVHTANLLARAGFDPQPLDGLRPLDGDAQADAPPDPRPGREISRHPVDPEAMMRTHQAFCRTPQRAGEA